MTQLSKELIAYSLVTAVITGKVSITNAEIIYTSTNVVLDSDGETFAINLDNTGLPEFIIGAHSFIRTSTGNSEVNRGVALAALYNEDEGTPNFRGSTATYAEALKYGDEVKNTDEYWTYRWGTSSWNMAVSPVDVTSTTEPRGKAFLNTTGRYLGLSFTISNKRHYGWCQVNVNSNASKAVITGYAYNDETDKDIFAGEEDIPEGEALVFLALGFAGVLYQRRRRLKFSM